MTSRRLVHPRTGSGQIRKRTGAAGLVVDSLELRQFEQTLPRIIAECGRKLWRRLQRFAPGRLTSQVGWTFVDKTAVVGSHMLFGCTFSWT